MAGSAVILGSGQIGQAAARRLLDGGWQVTLGSRGNRQLNQDLLTDGLHQVTLDREEAGAVGRAIAGGTDLLIDTVAFTAAHGRQLLDVQDDVGALAVISSAAVYTDEQGRRFGDDDFPHYPVPLAESASAVAPGEDGYAPRKAALEQVVLTEATVPAALLRPGAVHGEHSSGPREWWFVKRMLDERELIPVAFSGESTFQTTAAANLAELILTWAGRPKTMVLNAADPQAPTVLEIGRMIAEAMDYTGTIVPVAMTATEAGVGSTPWSVPRPLILDMAAAQALGYRPALDYAHAVPPLVTWLRGFHGANWQEAFPVFASYPVELFDYSAEDAFFSENLNWQRWPEKDSAASKGVNG